MLPLVLIGGAFVAGLGALASRWESDNEEEEEELERRQAQNQRFLKMRRAQLEKNRRKKAIKLELAAREKELKLVRRAELIAQRNLEIGKREVLQFDKELAMANKASLRLPSEWVDELSKELTSKTKDLKSVCRRCAKYRTEVESRIEELNGKRFFFKCCSCHRRFAVSYADLPEFTRSRKGMRKCCDNCYPTMRERMERKKSVRNFSRLSFGSLIKRM